VPLNVEMVSADRTLWSGEALSVGAPAADGDLGVLPGHQPVLALLRPGKIRVRPLEGEVVVQEVSGGFLSVDHDTITVVVDPMSDNAAASHED